MPHSPLRYVLYARKSSEDQEKQKLSIPAQLQRAKEQFRDLKIVRIIQEERSAFVPHNRPGFTEMLALIQEGQIDGIIAWHPDRLSRNELDAAALTYALRTGVIKDLKFCSYNFDNSPEGIWMLQMALSQSQYDSAKKGRDVSRGLQANIERGWWQGVAPEGYLNNPNISDPNRIIPDPDRFPVLQQAIGLVLSEELTPPKVLRKLNVEWGYTTVKRHKQGGRPMSRSTFYKMLTNPFYTGQMLYKGQLHPGKHEPMITLDEFDRIQQLLGRKGKPRPQKHEFAFTQMIQCEECACYYTAETKRKYVKREKIYRDYTYYHCTHKSPQVRCTQRKSIKLEDLEEFIDERLSEVTILPEFQDLALEILQDMNELEVTDRDQIYNQQSKAIKRKYTERDNLNRLLIRGVITDEEWAKNEQARIQAEIDKLKEARDSTEDRAEEWLELTEQIFDFATHARYRFEHGTKQEKRNLLRKLGGQVTARNGTLTLQLNEHLVPIKEAYPKLEAAYRRLEPAEQKTLTGAKTAQSAAVTALRTRWLPTPV